MIRLEGIEKKYNKENVSDVALDGVNLEIKQGEMIAIMGTYVIIRLS